MKTVTPNDHFEKETETLRGSVSFQRFLDDRSRSAHRIPLDEIEAEIESELARQGEPLSQVDPGD